MLPVALQCDGWTPEELGRAYVQLTEPEAAFRLHKSDFQIRPVWHHREARVGRLRVLFHPMAQRTLRMNIQTAG